MAKLIGFFESFDNLDLIPVEEIAKKLKIRSQLIELENFVANRILYPQAIPTTSIDMETDIVILEEALKINKRKKLPEDFKARFPGLKG